MDDKTLFEKIKNGDADAFEQLMRRYYDALCSFAMHLVGVRYLAEDIVQDVFENLWSRRHRIVLQSSLRSFLYISVRNGALNSLRAEKRLRTHADRYLTERRAEMFVIEDEKNRQLAEAIDLLPVRTGQVIRYSCEGLSQDDIAARMSITVATVKLLKSNGVKKLREMLGVVRCWLLLSI
jgi:RNA polymerase sigma-70 factor (ECF subfamily)